MSLPRNPEYRPTNHQETQDKKYLDSLPAIAFKDLFAYVEPQYLKPYAMMLDVNQISLTCDVRCWSQDLDKIEKRKIEFLDNPRKIDDITIRAFQLGGVIGIFADSQVTVAALKLIANEKKSVIKVKTVMNTVLPFKKVIAQSATEAKELINRVRMGYWSGLISTTSHDPNTSGLYASGNIDSYVGNWVFSRDYIYVRRILEQFSTFHN